MMNYKVGDRVVFHNVRDVPGYRKYEGVLGTVIEVAGAVTYPYGVDFGPVGVLDFVASEELELSSDPEPETIQGVWAIVDRDYHENITAVYPSMVDALHVLNGRGYGRVMFVPYGKTLSEIEGD